ncbi:MAG: polyprenyl synthetase family protein [Myxococcota bacterium]|nr:polyprenyl synthetase family protein [Myxococcota bacterium]
MSLLLTQRTSALVKFQIILNNPADIINASFALLREAASLERVGARAAQRMGEVHALLADDMTWVDRELARVTREGVRPATDSATHLLEAGGKRIRPLTVLLSAACFGPVRAGARAAAVAAELVHLATLLHDDVIDDGQERRGQIAPRRIWGNAISVLAGDLLLTHALERTAAATPAPVLADLFATLRRLVDGEVVQLRGRTRLDTREEVYFRIVEDKTASLFAWAARAGASSADAPAEAVGALGRFGERLGVAFQLIDDVLDYSGDPRQMGKALLADLVEGKLTLPLIRTLAQSPALIADVEAVRAGDSRAATAIAEAVRSSGTCEGVRQLAREETGRALDALATVPAGVPRELLASIAHELSARAA